MTKMTRWLIDVDPSIWQFGVKQSFAFWKLLSFRFGFAENSRWTEFFKKKSVKTENNTQITRFTPWHRACVRGGTPIAWIGNLLFVVYHEEESWTCECWRWCCARGKLVCWFAYVCIWVCVCMLEWVAGRRCWWFDAMSHIRGCWRTCVWNRLALESTQQACLYAQRVTERWIYWCAYNLHSVSKRRGILERPHNKPCPAPTTRNSSHSKCFRLSFCFVVVIVMQTYAWQNHWMPLTHSLAHSSAATNRHTLWQSHTTAHNRIAFGKPIPGKRVTNNASCAHCDDLVIQKNLLDFHLLRAVAFDGLPLPYSDDVYVPIILARYGRQCWNVSVWQLRSFWVFPSDFALFLFTFEFSILICLIFRGQKKKIREKTAKSKLNRPIKTSRTGHDQRQPVIRKNPAHASSMTKLLIPLRKWRSQR